MKKLGIIALALFMALSSGCGASEYRTATAQVAASEAPMPMPAAPAPAAPAPAGGFEIDAVYDEAEYEMAEAPAADMPVEPPRDTGGIAGPQTTPPQDGRKVIRSASLELQTTVFDSAVNSISAITESFGGHIENSYVSGRDMYDERGTRYASFTARIPSQSFDAFLNSFGGGEFNVIGKSTSSEDITETYFDSRARLESLKLQEQRLLSMLDNATELEYLIELERELMRVRYEIESINSSLNRMDSRVDYSTVNINLNEVVRYEEVVDVPVTFGQRISRALQDSWRDFAGFLQDFTVGFVEGFPFLLLWAAIIFAAVKITKKLRKGKKLFNFKRKSQTGQPGPQQETAPQEPPPAETE